MDRKIVLKRQANIFTAAKSMKSVPLIADDMTIVDIE